MRSKRYAVQNQGITLRKIIIKFKKKKQPTKQREKNHCKKRLRFMQSKNNNNDNKIFIVGSD